MKWIAICNGGPNNTTVGAEYTSLGKACGGLEAMMRNLGADLGHIYQEKTGQQKLDQDRFVAKEEDAGRSEEPKKHYGRRPDEDPREWEEAHQ